MALAALGVATLIVGVGRRVYDSRFYASIYEEVGSKVVTEIKEDQPSVKSARLGMIRELVEFLENSLPELISTFISLTGVLVIIVSLHVTIFYGSLIVSAIILLIYWVTSRKTIRLNKLSNDEFEKQVEFISQNDQGALKNHLKNMMKWNIRLSDLEAANFSLSWLVLVAFLVISIIIVTSDGIIKYGALFSLLMYVFQYMENVMNLPFFYQNWLRLQEILNRLEAS